MRGADKNVSEGGRNRGRAKELFEKLKGKGGLNGSGPGLETNLPRNSTPKAQQPDLSAGEPEGRSEPTNVGIGKERGADPQNGNWTSRKQVVFGREVIVMSVDWGSFRWGDGYLPNPEDTIVPSTKAENCRLTGDGVLPRA